MSTGTINQPLPAASPEEVGVEEGAMDRCMAVGADRVQVEPRVKARDERVAAIAELGHALKGQHVAIG